MRKTWRLNVLFVVISIIVGFMGIEFAYRLYLNLRYESVVPNEIGRFDPHLGWSLTPKSRAVSRMVGSIEYKINSKGLRDDEYEYNKPVGVNRIVIIGDSRTFGFGVPIKKHFTYLLEGYCENTEVINLGIAGFGVDQEFLFLQSEGIKYEPDLVIAYVAHYGNHRHMHTVRFGKSKPKFELRRGKLTLVNHPVVELPRDDQHILNSAVLRQLVTLFVKKAGENDLNAEVAQDVENMKDQNFMAELHKIGQAIIKEMKEFSNLNNSSFLLVTPIPKLIEFGRLNGIHVLNVGDALNNPLFALPDGLQHINEAGNGVLAWEIQKFIRANELVICGNKL